jgi:hypothetical protein
MGGNGTPHDGPVRFDFRFAPSYRLAALPFGVTPGNAWVEVTRDLLRARFGPWRLETARENITGTCITGPYGYLRTAGPAHLSMVDKGLTFASNGDRGLCMLFAEPVRGISRRGPLHPGLTVTVADVEALAACLAGETA